MCVYAIVDTTTFLVVNVVVWDGGEAWTAPSGCTAVESGVAGIGWSYVNGEFIAPPVEQASPPTAEESLAANTAIYEQLYSAASQAMTPLLVSLQLGDASDAETASAKAWQSYCRELKSVDLTLASPSWPAQPS